MEQGQDRLWGGPQLGRSEKEPDWERGVTMNLTLQAEKVSGRRWLPLPATQRPGRSQPALGWGLTTSLQLKMNLQEDKSFSCEDFPLLCIQHTSYRASLRIHGRCGVINQEWGMPQNEQKTE